MARRFAPRFIDARPLSPQRGERQGEGRAGRILRVSCSCGHRLVVCAARLTEQLPEARVACGPQCRREEATTLADLVAVRLGDLADDAVCSEEAELAADLARETLFMAHGLGWRVKQATEVTVAEARRRELAS